jgi:hypothetical protein
MKKNYFKLIGSTFIVGAFLFIAFGSGSDSKSDPKKFTKDYFCGKEFSMPHTIEAIDMSIKRVTILNCNGTYTSKEDWGTSSRNEETYRNTVGRSSGNNADFSGTWEVVDNKNLPSEIDSYLQNFEGHIDKFYNEKPFTILRYKSSIGKSGYLRVTDYNLNGQIILDHIITSSSGVGQGYKEADLNLYSGFMY